MGKGFLSGVVAQEKDKESTSVSRVRESNTYYDVAQNQEERDLS